MTPAEPTDPAERAFYVEEFAGSTIVAGIVAHDADVRAGLARAAASLDAGAARFAVVVEADAAEVARALGGEVAHLGPPSLDEARRIAPDEAAGLWLALTDARRVVVDAPAGATSEVAAAVAVATRATKLVLTDAAGGWGLPPRSFADIATHEDALRAQLADRQGGAVVEALALALHGGVANVNLCRPHDLDRELFTFDGAGTLFTSGGYVELSDLGVDDLPAVERLVAQGVAAGLLRPRSRAEVARLAATGLGARVVGSGHLAGLVSLETAPYEGLGVGEIASLSTVSRFSGAGAGALLVEGVVERAAAQGLREVFAVTVSEAAAAFFARRGFAEVEPGAIPAAKWAGYDADRRRLARAFVRSVTDGEQGTLGF